VNCLLCSAPGSLLCEAHPETNSLVPDLGSDDSKLGAYALKGKPGAAERITSTETLEALATAISRLSLPVAQELVLNPYASDKVALAAIHAGRVPLTVASGDWSPNVYDELIRSLPQEKPCQCESDSCVDCVSNQNRYDIYVELIVNRSVQPNQLVNAPSELTTAKTARTKLPSKRWVKDPIVAEAAALNPKVLSDTGLFDALMDTPSRETVVRTVQLAYGEVTR